MAAKAQPTLRSLAATVEVIEQQIQEVRGSLEYMHASRAAEAERIWTALGALAGLDGIAAGMAEIGELLAPLRLLVPPSTALPLRLGVPEALQTIRAALGGPDRDTNFAAITTDWDGPVGYIGEVP